MSGNDQIVSVMRSGAGLPVLSTLDRYIEAKARGEADAAFTAATLAELIQEIKAWLDAVKDNVDRRLSEADDGAFRAVLTDHAHNAIAARRMAMAEVAERAAAGAEPQAWAELEAEMSRLHALRSELGDVHRAAAHLREVARLVTDIPDDEAGRAALDELASLEAMAASHDTTADWLRAARELERRCTGLVRFEAPTHEPAKVTSTLDEPTHNGHEPKQAGTNGHGTVERPSLRDLMPKDAPQRPSSGRLLQVNDPVRASPPPQASHPPGRGSLSTPAKHESRLPAGRGVLNTWGQRAYEFRDQGSMSGAFRHAPFWAPIAQGVVDPPGGSAEDLLAIALEVEIDLVEIELPRVLAIVAGGQPHELRERIALRAEEITKLDPKQPARQTFLDHLVGKLPMRYRETAEGLALVESISHAVASDEPWELADHDYMEIVQRMVGYELERSPAVDLSELSTSLVGVRADAHEIVEAAAVELAADDDRITLYPDGILVRALAEREDPDLLYKLRGALESRLGVERASQLMRALITAGDGTDE